MRQFYQKFADANVKCEGKLVDLFELTEMERSVLMAILSGMSSRSIQKKFSLKKSKFLNLESQIKEKVVVFERYAERLREEGDELIIKYVSARIAQILAKYNIYTVQQLLNEALVYWMRIEELSKEHIDEIMRNIVYPYLRK